MKVLDLFAGTRSISKAFEERGHEAFSIEIDKKHTGISLYKDILEVTAQDIIEHFGRPDVIWASPPCTTYSIAGISHHRRKNPHTGECEPVSKFAHISDALTVHVLSLIAELNPTYWFIENPRGGMRTMKFMNFFDRHTITYCQYGEDRQKPTDIWTNHLNPRFHPACKQGAPCHQATPSGSRLGTQGLKNAMLRSIIPHELCSHIVDICEEVRNETDQRTTVLQEIT